MYNAQVFFEDDVIFFYWKLSLFTTSIKSFNDSFIMSTFLALLSAYIGIPLSFFLFPFTWVKAYKTFCLIAKFSEFLPLSWIEWTTKIEKTKEQLLGTDGELKPSEEKPRHQKIHQAEVVESPMGKLPRLENGM